MLNKDNNNTNNNKNLIIEGKKQQLTKKLFKRKFDVKGGK